MPVPVPAGVVFSYGLGKNVFTFGPYIKTRVTEKPVPGSGDRTVKYSEITIAVDGWISALDADAWAVTQGLPAGLPLDQVMLVIRRILQRHGSNLKYVNKGYGRDLNVNDPSGVASIPDVAMGPRAGDFHWHGLGGAPDGCHGAVFDWSVSCTIFECNRPGSIGGRLGIGGPSIFTDVTFTVNYATDIAGLVTITTNVKAEIPLSLNPANGGLDHQIDEYFVNIVRAVQPGFLRTMQRTLSADRRSVDAVILDKQIEIAYPDDVIEIDAKHKIKATNMAGARWSATITATIRLRPGAPKSLAWFRFYALVRDRMGWILVNGNLNLPVGTVPPVWEMEEDLFKNSARFSAFYWMTARLSNIIEYSGMWRPAGTNFARWLGTLSGNSQAPLGILGTRFDKSQDILLDACGNNTGGTSGNIMVGGVSETAGSSDAGGGSWDADNAYDPGAIAAYEPVGVTAPDGPDDGSRLEIQNSIGGMRFTGPDDNAGIADGQSTGADGWGSKMKVDPDTSWLDWRCSVTRLVDYRMIRHKPLSGNATTDTPPFDITAKGSGAQVAADVTPDSIGFTSTVPDIIQQVSSPSITLELRGYAIRFGFTVNAPKLISFGGVNAILAHESVTQTTLGAPDGNLYYRADWVLRYIIPSPPATISQVANPWLGTDGQP